ncbi:MAG: formyltetrahydrofolate deformylase [Kofleriaceae bacterium]
MATASIATPRTRSATMSGTAPKVGTLLVQAQHLNGIVSSIGQLLGAHRATIIDSNHHSDASTGMLFQRIQFDLAALAGDRVAFEAALGELAARHSMQWSVWYGERRRRIAIFASKQEHCLYDLLIRHRAGELLCDVAMVISNHPDAGPIARHFGVAFHHLPVTRDTRAAQEAQAISLLEGGGIDLVVLARYMQILSPEFVARFPLRIINIHHSFLPAFVGADPYRQAHQKGVKMIGATSHYVTADLDQGPIIEQSTVRVAHRDSVEDLVRKGRDLEKNTLAAAVRWHLDDRVLVHAGKTVVFD